MSDKIKQDKLYINGHWRSSSSNDWLTVVNSNTGQAMAKVPQASIADADVAVSAAKAAFGLWSKLPMVRRAEYLQRIADALESKAELLVERIAKEVGMPAHIARRVQVAGPIANWRFYAKLGQSFQVESWLGNSLILREAAGVVVAITPWNYPLNQITMKVAPALLAGCTVVLKPSEIAPLNAFLLAEAIAEAEVPPGVFNLVTGLGSEIGEHLVSHGDIDCVSFTGSTRAGKRVSELAARTVKRVSLELGGKSASIFLEGANLERAVAGTLASCFSNSGQACNAQTRLLVPRERFNEAKGLAATLAAAFVVGDAFDPRTQLGPLISTQQRSRVRKMVDEAICEGAELLCGNPTVSDDDSGGYFVSPTVLAVDDHRATIAQDEVFGPVLVVIPYDDEDDAVRIANDTPYGLGGAVWGRTDFHAVSIARRIRTGQIQVNGGPFNPQAPFGGFKQSGHGRECGVFGLEEFLEYKSLQLNDSGLRPEEARPAK